MQWKTLSLDDNTHSELRHNTLSADASYPPPPRWGGSIWSLWREVGESRTQTPGWCYRCRYPNRSGSHLTQWWIHPAYLYSHSTVSDHWSGLEIRGSFSCTHRSVGKCEGVFWLITDSNLGQLHSIYKEQHHPLATHTYVLGYGFLSNSSYSYSIILYPKISDCFRQKTELSPSQLEKLRHKKPETHVDNDTKDQQWN